MIVDIYIALKMIVLFLLFVILLVFQSMQVYIVCMKLYEQDSFPI